eukprot:5235700-Heterocapsa_arctica.AAC.1
MYRKHYVKIDPFLPPNALQGEVPSLSGVSEMIQKYDACFVPLFHPVGHFLVLFNVVLGCSLLGLVAQHGVASRATAK